MQVKRRLAYFGNFGKKAMTTDIEAIILVGFGARNAPNSIAFF
jgi:hypothetical protein